MGPAPQNSPLGPVRFLPRKNDHFGSKLMGLAQFVTSEVDQFGLRQAIASTALMRNKAVRL